VSQLSQSAFMTVNHRTMYNTHRDALQVINSGTAMNANKETANELVRMVVEDNVGLADAVRILNAEFNIGLSYEQGYHLVRQSDRGRLQLHPVTRNRAFLPEPDGRVRRLAVWEMRQSGHSIADIMSTLSLSYQVCVRDCSYERNKAREALWSTDDRQQTDD